VCCVFALGRQGTPHVRAGVDRRSATVSQRAQALGPRMFSAMGDAQVVNCRFLLRSLVSFACGGRPTRTRPAEPERPATMNSSA